MVGGECVDILLMGGVFDGAGLDAKILESPS
jgi:hypothetical protein